MVVVKSRDVLKEQFRVKIYRNLHTPESRIVCPVSRACALVGLMNPFVNRERRALESNACVHHDPVECTQRKASAINESIM